MKGQLDRTKVVLRHLPPLITRGALIDQIDAGCAGRYDWVAFRPGKSSPKQQIYSRAYINFKRPEDVIEFAEFFDGHVFVNEKGTQFKTRVEYAPSQRVPKLTSERDGREGTLLKDPEYLEFLEILSKPVENLPSAEIQLERREAERSGAAKEIPITTPLMDFVRQKRASKAASRRLASNKKLSGRAVSSGGPGSTKQGSEKRKNSKAMYVLRDSARSSRGKDASTITLASRRDDQHISDKSMSSIVAVGADRTEVESGSSGVAGSGKKKILLLKGKEREIYHMASNASGEQFSAKDLAGPTAVKQNQRQEGSGRIIRGILVNKNAKQNQSGVHSDNQTQTTHAGREKMPPRAPNLQPISKEANGAIDEKVHGNGASSFGNEKLERRVRNKDRPDRGVWAPLRRIDGSHGSGSSSSSHLSDSSEGFRKVLGRQGLSQVGKDNDGSSPAIESKSSKRGSSPGFSAHERQVWVQKSSSGT